MAAVEVEVEVEYSERMGLCFGVVDLRTQGMLMLRLEPLNVGKGLRMFVVVGFAVIAVVVAVVGPSFDAEVGSWQHHSAVSIPAMIGTDRIASAAAVAARVEGHSHRNLLP